MTLPILKGLHQDYLHSLLDEGILNDQFNGIHSQRRTEEPDYIVKLIESYFRDVEAILSDLSSHTDDGSNVDLTKLSALAREIEDKSKSIGAELVKLASPGLIEASDENHKRKFDRSLMWVQSDGAEAYQSDGVRIRIFIPQLNSLLQLLYQKHLNTFCIFCVNLTHAIELVCFPLEDALKQ